MLLWNQNESCLRSVFDTHYFEPKQLLRNNIDNRVLQINTPKVISFFTSKVWNYAKLYPLLETTAQKATPFALHCDCLYICSLRTWVLTAWALRDFALERLLSEQ